MGVFTAETLGPNVLTGEIDGVIGDLDAAFEGVEDDCIGVAVAFDGATDATGAVEGATGA